MPNKTTNSVEAEKEMELAAFRIEIKGVFQRLEKKYPGRYELILANVRELDEQKMGIWNHFMEILRKMESPNLFDEDPDAVKLQFALLYDELSYLENQVVKLQVNNNGGGGRVDASRTETAESQFFSWFASYLAVIKSVVYGLDQGDMKRKEYEEEIKLLKKDFGK